VPSAVPASVTGSRHQFLRFALGAGKRTHLCSTVYRPAEPGEQALLLSNVKQDSYFDLQRDQLLMSNFSR
jgi:hypothetical protein